MKRTLKVLSATRGLWLRQLDEWSLKSAADKAEDLAEGGGETNHRLNARVLVETFSRRGLICAVIAPRFDEGGGDASLTDLVNPAVKRADIVIFDWRLNNDSGKKTMSILKNILERDAAIDPGGRLRLVAVYTGEQDLSGIGGIILEGLEGFEGDEHNVVLSREHCRILIYAKSEYSTCAELGKQIGLGVGPAGETDWRLYGHDRGTASRYRAYLARRDPGELSQDS